MDADFYDLAFKVFIKDSKFTTRHDSSHYFRTRLEETGWTLCLVGKQVVYVRQVLRLTGDQ